MEVWRGLCLAMVITMMVTGRGEGLLVENFYKNSCPNVESIVKQAVTKKLNETTTTIPGTLRLFLHDCFVEGCDASIIISSPTGEAERDATLNLSLAGDGFDTVTKAKAAVEAVCPGVVSCADILALAARDVVVLANGPAFKVELGRRDGLISNASHVPGNLPLASFNLSQLNSLFSKHNLSQTDMIALSGAHTVGFSHCSNFFDRLYNFSSTSQVDPSLNSTYAQELMRDCPRTNGDPTVVIALDPVTPLIADNQYYKDLVEGKGLLTSDQVLFSDTLSKQTVRNFANNPDNFNSAFANSMRKLGRVGVKTGSQGQIRKDCAAFNS